MLMTTSLDLVCWQSSNTVLIIMMMYMLMTTSLDLVCWQSSNTVLIIMMIYVNDNLSRPRPL